MRFFLTLLIAASFCNTLLGLNTFANVVEPLVSDHWDSEDYETLTIEEPDPIQGVNRMVFEFNRVADGLVLKPIAIIYDQTVHHNIKKGVTNFTQNITEPLTLVNNLLQGNGHAAACTLARFCINSTLGILGLIDVGKGMGLKREPANFNQTLAKWGAEPGPYIVLPLLGPSSFRGAFGTGADVVLNPVNLVTNNNKSYHNRYYQRRNQLYGIYALDMISRRARLVKIVEDIEKTSVDDYATIRNIYFQQQK